MLSQTTPKQQKIKGFPKGSSFDDWAIKAGEINNQSGKGKRKVATEETKESVKVLKLRDKSAASKNPSEGEDQLEEEGNDEGEGSEREEAELEQGGGDDQEEAEDDEEGEA